MERRIAFNLRGCEYHPSWVLHLNHSSICWAAYHKTILIKPMGLLWPPSSSYTGGNYTRSCDWPDPPTGPTAFSVFLIQQVYKMGKYTWAWLRAARIDKGLNNERSTQSDRVEARPDTGGTCTVTDRHGGKHKFPDNRWCGPPCQDDTVSSHDKATRHSTDACRWAEQ